MSRTLFELKSRIFNQQREEAEKAAQRNLEEGKAFLAENAKTEGVVVRASGLQYKVLQEGAGRKPGPGGEVTVHYRGRFANGTVFDDSYERNSPATVPVEGIMPGWTEALQLMKKGAIWELYLPPQLAYGARGRSPRIPPNSTLVFALELISVNVAE